MNWSIRIGWLALGHMKREDGRPGWWISKHGANAMIGPGSTGPLWKMLVSLVRWWPAHR